MTTIATDAKTAPGAPKEPYFPEPLIDRQIFLEWNKACRVRQIQDRYSDMLEKAGVENLSLEQYMKKNGMNDYTSFLMSCPPFDFFCWPSALAELGSGFVLYFHFLSFLGSFLLIAFLVQIPAIAEYWKEDAYNKWKTKAAADGEHNVKMIDNLFIFTSPGMLGPKKSDNDTVPFCYFVLVAIICGAVVAKSAWQVWVDHGVDMGTTQPNDFAIMVEGLPATATDESAIMEFFKKNAIHGKETEVVKVVIGWTATEYREKMRQIKELNKELKELPPDDPEAKVLQGKIKQINEELMSAAPEIAARLHSSGVAVVSFRKQQDLRACLVRWNSLWCYFFYRDWGAWGGLCAGPHLPKFPTAAGIGVWKIRVRRAPNPGDINWDDLGVPASERYWKFLETNGCMVLIIAVSFGVTYGMMVIKNNAENMWLGLLPAIGLAVANMAVAFASKHFGEKEYHNTVTGQTGSQSLKMTCGMIINTAAVILFINHKDWEWYKTAGLVSDIVLLIAVTAVGQPLFQLLDFKYSTIGRWQRSKLKDDTINRLRGGAQWYNDNAVTKETVEDFKSFRSEYQMTMQFFKKAFEPSDMDMKRRYAYAVRTFVCCIWYCHLVPFLTLLGIAGITVQYWVDKKMLLRWYKRPSIPQGKDQAVMSLFFLRFATLLMPLCMWFFLTPSFKNSGTIVKWLCFSYVPAAGICLLPLSGIRWVLCASCRGRRLRLVGDAGDYEDMKDDYYQAQHLWPKELKYHKSHRLYTGLPESINPEILDPSVSAAAKADDVQKSYGASSKAAAASASAPTSGVKLADGSVVGADASAGAGTADPGGGAATATDPAPTTYGVSAPAPKAYGAAADTSGGGAGAEPAISPTVISVGGADPGVAPAPAPAAATAGGGGPVWEMNVSKGWSKMKDDCHDHIEKQYQKYKTRGGEARITVRTMNNTWSLDMEKMTIMMVSKGKKGGPHGVKQVRRTEGP